MPRSSKNTSPRTEAGGRCSIKRTERVIKIEVKAIIAKEEFYAKHVL